MINNGGVVIRVTWELLAPVRSLGAVMTEWVPLVTPTTLVLMPAAISENAGVSTVTATLDRTKSAAATITVSASPGAGTDFTLTGTTLTIAAGATTSTGTVTITASDNSVGAPDKSVTVSGTATGGAANPSDVTLTIADDDDLPALSIDSPSMTEGGSGTFTVTLSRASALPVAVGYADAGTGTATSGADYTAIPAGTLTFTAGTTSQTIAVTVTGDALDDTGETIVLTLSAPVNATLAAASGTGTIADDLMPSFGDAQVPAQRYVQGLEIDPLVLPVATGGDGPLAYTLAPALPEGLGYTAPADATSGGALAGTPTVPAQAAAWTLTATDADGDTATLTFTIEVAPDVSNLTPSFGGAQVPAQRYVQGLEIDPLVLPAATGGDGPLVYALAPALPDGLGYTSPADARSGGTLAGTPTVSAQAAAWTLTATDADGDTAALTFTIEVAPDVSDLAPSFGDAQVPAQRYVQGLEIDPLVLPAATGGDGPLAYTLAPALPDGLGYTAPADARSGGALTGTPAVPAQAAAWTLTATDADGDTATLTFTVEVAPNLMPSFGGAQVPAQRYVQGLEIDPLVLPAATGGDGPLAYTLAPTLPDGLGYTAPADARSGGALTGTPTAPAQAAAWTLTATDADGDTATLTFTIEVLDRLRVRLKGINEALLPDLSRAMTASTMDAVSGRIGQALSVDGAGARGAMASADVLTGLTGLLQANEQALEDGTWSWKQGLAGRRFALALSGAGERDGAGAGAAPGLGADPATDTGARVTVWGAGDYRSLAGGEGSEVDWDGHLFGAHLGMDARFGAGGLGGLALSVSKGSFDYTDTSAAALGKVEGEYESRMTSAHPYVGWAWPAGRHAWASLGYGRGDVTLIDGEAGRQTSDSTLRSATAGGSVRVLTGEGPGLFGPVTVDLKGEAQTTRLEVEDNGERIAGLKVRTHRLRGAVQGARAFALSGGGLFTPSVELGMRFDRGDGETGAGVELGGGLDYAHPALGLRADVTGRVLLAHEGETEDWSVGGSVRLEPASGRGLSLRLAPSYGETGSSLARLWEDGVAGSGAGATGAGSTGASPTARLDTEMGYGLAAFAGVLTPYGGVELSEGGTRGYRLGARFLLGPAFELGLEGERRESRPERAEHGLMLRGRVRW